MARQPVSGQKDQQQDCIGHIKGGTNLGALSVLARIIRWSVQFSNTTEERLGTGPSALGAQLKNSELLLSMSMIKKVNKLFVMI